jgi:hypothetical protein
MRSDRSGLQVTPIFASLATNRTRCPFLMTNLSTFALIVSALFLVPCKAKAQSHTVAMTVDDLPFVSGTPQPLDPSDANRAAQVNEKMLRTFASQHIPTTGFVIDNMFENSAFGRA